MTNGVTEQTALDLLQEIMALNSNMRELIDCFKNGSTQPKKTKKGSPDPKKPDLEQEAQLPMEPPEPYEPPFETTSSIKVFDEGKYQFFGDPACDPSREGDIPGCYGKEYNTPPCQKKIEKCIFNLWCKKLMEEQEKEQQTSEPESPEVITFQQHIEGASEEELPDEPVIVDPPQEPDEEEELSEEQQNIMEMGKRIKALKDTK